jgi:hypothetical protein
MREQVPVNYRKISQNFSPAGVTLPLWRGRCQRAIEQAFASHAFDPR